MPELPEVETVRLGLVPAMEGARFVKVEARRPDLRWPFPKDFVSRLEGKTVTGLGRRAKYLLADLSSGEVLVMHLGMSGSFRVGKDGAETTPGDFQHERSKADAHDHVVFHMSSGARVTFNDPRRFGFMKLVPRVALDVSRHCVRSGRSRSANEFGAALLARSCRGKKTSLKAALSDQRVVAGLGNIYVCEALNRARLSPKRRAGTIAAKNGEPNERASRACRRDQGGAQRCHQGWRLVVARSSPHRRRAWRLPAFVSCLRPRRQQMPDPQLPRQDPPHRANRTVNVLLPGVPEVIRLGCLAFRAVARGAPVVKHSQRLFGALVVFLV
jgi:formamidopyrimidine-DNA glycosylase